MRDRMGRDDLRRPFKKQPSLARLALRHPVVVSGVIGVLSAFWTFVLFMDARPAVISFCVVGLVNWMLWRPRGLARRHHNRLYDDLGQLRENEE
jgi:hypothetical protein